jgi:hypothetical protein
MYDRFPLAGNATVEPGILELRRLFMVRASDAEPAHRLASLSPDTAEDLAVALCAYVLRHGPLAGIKNAGKLAVLLTGQEVAGDPELRIGQLVSEVVNSAWRFEGRGLGGISEAYDGAAPKDEAITELVDLLDTLGRDAAVAAEAIRVRLKPKQN